MDFVLSCAKASLAFWARMKSGSHSKRRKDQDTEAQAMEPAHLEIVPAIQDPLLDERARLAPSDRELALLLRLSFGREVETFEFGELELARLVFAQVALMAGAALSADSEVFVGAEKLWREMEDRIGKQERTLAKRFLQLLAQDEMHTQSERDLLTRLSEGLDDRQGALVN